MAKNNYRMNVNQYANQEDNIRKAKGNPNKNIHHKKKNSNYGGYTAGSYMAQRIMDKANQQERVKLPTWLKVWLGVLFAAVIVVLILRLTVYKDSILLNSLSSLLYCLPVPVLHPPLQAHEKGQRPVQGRHRDPDPLRRHLHVHGRGGTADAGRYPVKNRIFRQNCH